MYLHVLIMNICLLAESIKYCIYRGKIVKHWIVIAGPKLFHVDWRKLTV